MKGGYYINEGERDPTMDQDFSQYDDAPQNDPLFLQGHALQVLPTVPDESVDMVFADVPLFMTRGPRTDEIGRETSWQAYIDDLVAVSREIYRVLKPTGSFWLRSYDLYLHHSLVMIPQRLALRLTGDEVGFTLRNQVVWEKPANTPDNAQKRLKGGWNPLFFLTKQQDGYYQNDSAIRRAPKRGDHIPKTSAVSATGISGRVYRQRILQSPDLSLKEKENACAALDEMMSRVQHGEIPDFRMVIRGMYPRLLQRRSHRSKELLEKGYYFITYSNRGARLNDVWSLNQTEAIDLMMSFTCPSDGVFLDPFATGISASVAQSHGVKSVQICPSEEALEKAKHTYIETKVTYLF